jgi:hypothetical protein
MAQPLFVSEAPGAWVSQAMVILLTLVPLLAVFYGRLRTGAWSELAERFYNRSWSPSDETDASPLTVPVTSGLSRPVALGCAVAGIAGLGFWIGGTSFTTHETPLTASRTEAEQTARTALQEAGGTPSNWTMAAAVRTPNGLDDRFVWQEGGPDAYRQLMGSYLDAPLWQVRFYTFADSLDVEARAEEYRVRWGPGWGLREVIHEQPEAAPGDSLTEAQARAVADSALRARTTLNPSRLKRIGAEPTARPNRRDWTFTYADTTGYPLDQGQARVLVELTGAEVQDVSRTVHVPESWQREARSRRTDSEILGAVSGILLALLVVAGFIASIVWWARGPFRTWTFVGVAGVVFGVLVASAANEWPTTMASLDTAQPYLTQVLLNAIGPLVAAVFGAGAAGLFAGVLHPRVGGAAPTPLWRSLVGGVGVGALGSGLLALAGTMKPDLSPSWASYDALPTVLPWLDPLLDRVPVFVFLTLVLLLGAVALHRWTKAGQTRGWGAAGALVGVGFVSAGVASASSLGAWAVTGAVLTGLFALGYAAVVRVDRSVLPMATATIIGLGIVKAMVTAAHPYALPGEALALVVIVGAGIYWTHLLRRRQREFRAPSSPQEAPAESGP